MLHASAAQQLCSARNVDEAAVEKRENGFGAVIVVGCLAVSRDQSGIVTPVVKKEDRVAQKEPCFKMQNRPTSPWSSNKAVRSRWMPALPPWAAIECISATPVNVECVVWSLASALFSQSFLYSPYSSLHIHVFHPWWLTSPRGCCVTSSLQRPHFTQYLWTLPAGECRSQV